MFCPQRPKRSRARPEVGAESIGRSLRRVELLLALLAARALPILGKILEGHAIVLGRIIDIATDGADVLSRSHVGNKIMCDCFLFAK